MKKIIKQALCFLVAACGLSACSFATNEPKANTIDLKGEQTIRRFSPQIRNEAAENANPVFDYSGTTKDRYENNDTPETATLISPAPTDEPSDYSATIEATLHRNVDLLGIQTGIDTDYYRFDVYGNANVIMTLSNIPANTCYDLDWFEFPNNPYATYSDLITKTPYHENGSMTETIPAAVCPGSYFMRVTSHEAQTFDDVNPYSLSVAVSYQRKTEKISNLHFNKNAKAAYWVSDFAPCHHLGFNSSSKEQLGTWDYISTTTSDGTGNIYTFPTLLDRDQNPFLKALRSYTNGRQIRESELLIWDPALKREIYDTLNQICEKLIPAVSKYRHDKVSFEVAKQSSDTAGVLSCIFSIVGLIPYCAPASIVSLAFTGVQAIMSFIAANMFNSYDDIDSEVLLGYVETMKTAVAPANDADYRVAKISSFYKLTRENTVSSPACTSYASFADYTPLYDREGYQFSGDTITSCQSNSFFTGRTYGIMDEQSLQNALCGSYQASLANANSAKMETLSLGAPSIELPLNEGEYRWFAFRSSNDARYRFYSEGTGNLDIEVFQYPSAARDTDHRYNVVCTKYDGHNAEIEWTVRKDETTYFRIHEPNYSSGPQFVFRASFIEYVHVHHYNDHYVYVDDSHHRAFCTCGLNRLESHVISSKSQHQVGTRLYGTCLDCGASIDLNGSGRSIVNSFAPKNITHSSPNGALLLSENDTEDFESGMLVL